MQIILSDTELSATLKAFEENHGNQTATAKQLGIARSTLQNRLASATSRGLGNHFISSAALPQALTVGATSTLYGTDGHAKLQWVKSRWASPEITIAAIKDAFDEYDTKPPVLKAPAYTGKQLVTVYPIADLHFGMYSWKEETGDSYDTDIAASTLLASFSELIGRSIPSDLGVVLNLGDFFHADNDEQRTRKSGNKMDVDTRYARVLREGVKLMMDVIALARLRHGAVLVKNIPGNHDPYGSLALTTALAAYYSKDERVIVDTEADPIWHYSMGRTLITAAHGDMARPADMPGIAAQRFAKEWGETDWRYAYLGHTHQRRLKKPDAFEGGGMEVEVFRTLAPKDAWGTQMGHVARRSLVGITHDHKHGEIHRSTVNVK